MFATAAAFLGMELTSWEGSPAVIHSDIEDTIAFWIKIASIFLTILLYIWSAPHRLTPKCMIASVHLITASFHRSLLAPLVLDHLKLRDRSMRALVDHEPHEGGITIPSIPPSPIKTRASASRRATEHSPLIS